jgi:uncharacterized repeat protein (TIGR03803 family)
LRVTRFLARGLAAFVLLLAAAGWSGQGASASTYKVIYDFCSQANCNDGGDGIAGLVRDPSGVFFGNALMGGGQNKGTVFALIPNGSSFLYQVLYSFCSQSQCADGALPTTTLIEDGQTNLYGTTTDNSTHHGTVFKLSFNGGVWTLTQLYAFCSGGGSCADGAVPNARLTYKGAASGAAYDGTSPLYGTTQLGGDTNGGVVFQLTPTTSGPWTLAVLGDLCPTCKTGSTPGGGAIMDASGNLFVNTKAGGGAGDGTVIELTQNKGKWKATPIYSFCSAKKCKDGSSPSGPIALDAKGDLIGSTLAGGKKKSGTLFELTQAGKKWSEKVLYGFCGKKTCPDGAEPVGVSLDDAGNVIGAAQSGGNVSQDGTAFSFNAGTLDTLYQFCQGGDTCSDGSQPASPPIADGSGNLFGTTYQGGSGTGGVIYEITP